MMISNMHARGSIYLIYVFMLSVHLRAQVFISADWHSFVYIHGCAPEEQGTTARSRDTRAPVTGGVASDARLAACCLCRMGIRR